MQNQETTHYIRDTKLPYYKRERRYTTPTANLSNTILNFKKKIYHIKAQLVLNSLVQNFKFIGDRK